MCVSLATQTSSRSVAAGITTYCILKKFPEEAIYTSRYINNIHHLFDLFNCGKKNHYKENCGITVDNHHFTFLDVAMESSSYKFIGSKKNLSCGSRWLLNISSLKLL